MVVPRPRPPRHRGVHQTGRWSRSRRSPPWWPAPRLIRRRLQAILGAAASRRATRDRGSTAKQNPALRAAIREARAAMVPDGYIQTTPAARRPGGDATSSFPELRHRLGRRGATTRSPGRTRTTRVRVPERTSSTPSPRTATGHLTRRTDGKVGPGRIPARDLWDQIAYAAWACADPGVQYDTTINEWHTCPADGPDQCVEPLRDRRHAGGHGRGLAADRRAGGPKRADHRRGRPARTWSTPDLPDRAQARVHADDALGGYQVQAHRRTTRC